MDIVIHYLCIEAVLLKFRLPLPLFGVTLLGYKIVLGGSPTKIPTTITASDYIYSGNKLNSEAVLLKFRLPLPLCSGCSVRLSMLYRGSPTKIPTTITAHSRTNT